MLADNNSLDEACDHAAASKEMSSSFSRSFGVHLSYYMARDQSTGCGSIRLDVTRRRDVEKATVLSEQSVFQVSKTNQVGKHRQAVQFALLFLPLSCREMPERKPLNLGLLNPTAGTRP